MNSGDVQAHLKNGSSRFKNCETQPLKKFHSFNRAGVITEGWYPAFASPSLKNGCIKPFTLLNTRLAVYRAASGEVAAVDAFCPHMGADLNTGRVVGQNLECYFHRWQFSTDGTLVQTPSDPIPSHCPKLNSYPVEEKYGFIWIYSGAKALYPVPEPPAVSISQGPWNAWYVGKFFLHAHHHIMMVNGIDLQHFSTVHNLDIEFDYEVFEQHGRVFDWSCQGKLPLKGGIKVKLARLLLGERVGYDVRFAGGSVVTITYGPQQLWRGKGRKLTPLHIVWGCEPLANGTSAVNVFIVQPRRRGLIGKIQTWFFQMMTAVLLMILKDDDEKAFPNMRFNPLNLTKSDHSVARLIALLDRLPISTWSQNADGQKQEQLLP